MNTLNLLIKKAIFRGKSPVISSIFAGITIGLCVLGIFMAHTTNADSMINKEAAYVAKEEVKKIEKEVKTISVIVTAYSSSWDETTGIPGVSGTVTASGKPVAPEIVANNMLPFGTKVRIPSLFGDKIFVVGDRMNKRMGNHRFDLWFPSKELAKNFGVKTAELEILEN